MGRIGGGTSVSLAGTTISCRPGTVRVTSPAVFSAPGTRWRQFVERIARVPEVNSVEIDRQRGTAIVSYSARTAGIKQILERLSAALAAPESEPHPGRLSLTPSSLAGRSRIRLFCRNERLSTWEIAHDAPGRLRVRDAELRRSPATAQRITVELAALPGVRDVSVSTLTGSVLVRYDAAIVARDALLTWLDDLVREGGMVRCESLPRPAQWLFANATLGLAAAGALLYPPLLPASAALLVASNITTFQNAWRQIRGRVAGLPVLHTAIVGATLATGGFLAASLMNWLLVYWEDRRARLTAAGHEMLSGAVRPPRLSSAWVLHDGVELETPLGNVRAGDVVTIRAGETIPVDGKIVGGTGVIDERSLRGTAGVVYRGIGDSVLAGSSLAEGALQVAVLRAGGATAATAIVRTLSATAGGGKNGQPAPRPEFAERAVPPALITAGVGLLVGDAAVAAAVLRPDYATGPSLGGSLALIDRLGTCFDEGIVIRRPEVFERVAEADVIVFDHDRFLEARRQEVACVHVAGGFSAAEVLAYAACGTRDVHDPRARAVAAACTAPGGEPLHRPVTYRAAGGEFTHGGRAVRVTGLECGRDAPQSSPLFVFVDGELAGSVTFGEGTGYAAAEAIRDLRVRCDLSVELLSSAPEADAEKLATALGVDGLHLCPSDEARGAVIRRLGAQGRRVIFVGDCRCCRQAAEAAPVAVFPSPDPAWEADPSGVWLFGPHFEKLVALRQTAVAMRSEAVRHCQLVLIPNLACVAGAFLFGFTSLAVVVLSNLGTYSIYSQSRAALHRTERRLLTRRGRGLRPSSRPRHSSPPRLLPQGTQ